MVRTLLKLAVLNLKINHSRLYAPHKAANPLERPIEIIIHKQTVLILPNPK